MVVMAVGPILQQFGARRRRVGIPVSADLCRAIFAGGGLALKAGGLPLMFGMTIFAGLVEIGVSRLLRPLRPYFPPEIAGFVVVMISITVGMLGFRSLFDAGGAQEESSAAALGIAASRWGP